ncbi:MAG: ABC transporter ATP-binding protein, partial [Candidatus Actinomarina sp.]
MGAINISNVGKIYPNGTRALEDINIEINDGEFVVLVGPSGCGKTTLLRMVAGLEDITEGEISIADKVVNEVAPKDRDIAMVFQNYALYPHMSVYDNMAFSLKLRKLPKDEIDKKVKEAAKTLEISELLDRKPKALSGGQRQRVAMGRAIVRSPQAFLMDEPLSNLDAKLRVQMRAELGQLHSQLETTTLYVTHDQVEAMTMGDRVAVIRKGKLQQIDTPRMIYLYPNNIFVAGFIGSPSMNFVYAHTKLTKDGTEITFGDSTIISKNAPENLKDFEGKEIVLG